MAAGDRARISGHYLTNADRKHYQPANITFDLLPALDEAARTGFEMTRRRAMQKCAGARETHWRSIGGRLCLTLFSRVVDRYLADLSARERVRTHGP